MHKWRFPKRSTALYLLSPATVALLMIAITGKKQGLKKFIGELIPTNTNISWLALSIILPIIILLGGKIIYQLFNEGGLSFSTTPLGFGFIIIVIIGSIGEERGWRAYLLPLLLKKHNNKIIASVVLGIL